MAGTATQITLKQIHIKARRKLIKSLKRAAILLFFISSLFVAPGLRAQTVIADSAVLISKTPDAETLRRLSDDERLQYKEVQGVRKNLVTEFFRWLIEKLFRNTTERDVERIADIVKWVLIISSILLIVYFLFRDEINKALFFRNRKLGSSVRAVGTEEFQSDNLDDMIAQLMAEKNYSAALRFMYIRALQLLHEKGFIYWTKEKTNSELVSELRNHKDSTALRSLGSLFEYVHYGNFEANEKIGNKASEELIRIKKLTAE